MEPDSLSAESAFPPPPPKLPPPVPPPVAAAAGEVAAPSGDAHSLRRWTGRLALVVVGLTLFLLGIVTGRVFGPDEAGSPSISQVVAAESESTEAPAAEERYTEEVNPPDIFAEVPAKSVPASVTSAPSAARTEGTSQPKIPSVLAEPKAPAAVEPSVSVASEAKVPEPQEAAQLTTPVSLVSRVPTIKPLSPAQVCEPEQKFKDRKLETALTWAESVQEALEQAENEDKLVFLIHVSGNFEMPGFT